MSVNEAAMFIDKSGFMNVDNGLTIPVSIRDVKVVYGIQRFLVQPIGGHGEKWVNAVRVNVTN